MNILLWYLPYAMFSGACNVASESEVRTADESRAECAERMRATDKPPSAAVA
jgi:hypothetical protein